MRPDITVRSRGAGGCRNENMSAGDVNHASGATAPRISPRESSPPGDMSMNFSKSCIAAAVIAGLLPCATMASSHREAPNITRMPTVDATDFYLFNSYEPGRDGYVTLLANYIPLQSPYGGPNYFAMD